MIVRPGLGPVLASFAGLIALFGCGARALALDEIPAAWSGIDIGPASPEGSSSSAGDSFTLNAGSPGLSADSDGFHFVYRSYTGDFTITSHLQPLLNAPAATAGLMVREEIAANSNYVGVFLGAGRAISVGVRSNCSPSATVSQSSGIGAGATWLRLVKRGGSVRAYAAEDSDGQPGRWTPAGPVERIANEMVFVGMMTASGSPGTMASETFSHLRLADGIPAPDDADLTVPSPANADPSRTSYQGQRNSWPNASIPHGEMLTFDLVSKKYYPGSKSTVLVYVPKEYDPSRPACLYVGLDGPGFDITNVLDNLIYKGLMPVTIGVFVPSGSVTGPDGKTAIRYNRCFEYDSINDRFDRYLVDEVLPLVAKLKTSDGRAINISTDPNDHMIAGASSGGVDAFTAAWQHPDLFRRVFSAIGTYVGMRGADEYPTLIRKTEPKPIRIFQQDGAIDSWNPLFDNWYTQNRSMEESLSYAGYDDNHNWGVLGHEGSQAESLLPSAMIWMWRDYPAPISPGRSSNSMLNTILVKGETWQPVPGSAGTSPTALTSDPDGAIYWVSEGTGTIYKSTPDAGTVLYANAGAPVAAEAFTASGTLYASEPSLHRIIAITPVGKRSVIATGIAAGHLTVLADGTIYASEPAAHDDLPSTLWRIDPSGKTTRLARGIYNATGILATAGHNEVFVAEGRTHWIYSFVLNHGSLIDKQRYYWLHTAEQADDDADDSAGTTDIAEGASGYVYAATRMGVQVCDMNGRVEAILTLPGGPITSLTFSGKAFDTLVAVCGGRIYIRQLNEHGHPGFADIIKLPDYGAG